LPAIGWDAFEFDVLEPPFSAVAQEEARKTTAAITNRESGRIFVRMEDV
jgi:hypothetical protein